MPIKSHITDPSTGHQAQVNFDPGEDQALVVATRPLKTFENVTRFFTSDTYGINMNIGVEVPDTPDAAGVVPVHDGGDNVYWTASSISGTWTFSDPAQNHTPGGTSSVNGSATINDSLAQFAKGSNLDLSDYNSLSGWIYITLWPTGGGAGTKEVLIYGWNDTLGIVVGNSVNIGNYVNVGNLGTWQNFAIPLSDLGLNGQTIDAIRVRTVDIGPKDPPDYWLDDIQFNPSSSGGGGSGDDSPATTGDLGIFIVEPNLETWLHVSKMTLTFVAAYDSTLANGTLPGIPYNGILGVSLTSGIVYQRVQNGTVLDQNITLNLIDLIQLPTATIVAQGADDTFTWFSVDLDFIEPVILKPENKDKLQFIIADNLSGLEFFRVLIGGKEEHRGLPY